MVLSLDSQSNLHLRNLHHFPPNPINVEEQQSLQLPRKRSYFSSSSSSFGELGLEYAPKMGDSHHHQTPPPSRLGMRGGGGGGEIVEVQGGHILRSTGRKDRHSKVCTAKGPRDRRVRLSAPTAIQFYDVQDRLGYDRPSKAVDWLIKKAKAAIDELAELPAWTPTTTASANPRTHQEQLNEEENENENEFRLDALAKRATTTTTTAMVGRDIHYQIGENQTNASNFLPPSLDSDAIADTIKSFFPMGASAETPSSSIQFQSYPPDLLSRTGSHSQDLRLSLQSFQDPMILHHQQAAHNHAQAQQNEHALFSATTGPVGFDGGWSHHQQAEISRFQRMVGWNAGGADTGISGGTGGGGGGGGFIFHSSPTSTVQLPPPPQPFFGHNQLFFQRGPLQSSNTPSIRAWIDPSIAASDHQRHQIQPAIYQSSISGIGYASGEFSGFCFPARIQGEEEHDGIPSSKPSSASSDSANE